MLDDDNDTAPRAYSIAEACQLLGIGRTTLHELVVTGQVRSIKLGPSKQSRRLIPADALREFLERSTTQQVA